MTGQGPAFDEAPLAPSGGHGAVYSSPGQRRADVEHAVAEAIKNGHLALNYQPEISLATGAFVGVETLVRMPRSALGPLRPDEFVPVAEQSDLIHDLGRWVLSGAVHDTSTWNSGSSGADFMTAVNVSPKELLRPRFVDSLLTVLESSGFDPARLCIEVTETAVVEALDRVIRALRDLRSHGVRLAIDDFGTGHASLDHLVKFPADIVKVDRTFVGAMLTEHSSAVIVESVIAMAHALGKTVVAEGVETDQQLGMLIDLGCDIGQGYLFARPEDAASTRAMLQTESPWPAGVARHHERSQARLRNETRVVGQRRQRATGTGLPTEPSSFVGRQCEIAEVAALLAEHRIVSVTGPGGVGKTRISVEVAGGLADRFPDGIWYIELAELRESTLLPNLVASKLGMDDLSGHSALDSVVERLADATALLVLDNCEHLIDAASAFVDRVAVACANVRFLATSRQSLGLTAEFAFPLAPLSLPSDDAEHPLQQAQGSDAVRLFLDRAKAVVPSFVLDAATASSVLRIVRRLDGIPLAIELAAARLRSLSIQQLEERLSSRLTLLTRGERNATERRQTLRGAIGWSYDLCTGDERLFWARASVFSGGFDLETAEAVCGVDPIDPADVLDLVDALIDKSVIIRDTPQAGEPSDVVRYRMLETIREYGEERLRATDTYEAACRTHLEYFAARCTQCNEAFLGPDEVDWMRWMTRERSNLRVALDYAFTTPGEVGIGIGILADTMPSWDTRGLLIEAIQWLNQALAVTAEPAQRCRALRVAAWFQVLLGPPVDVEHLLSEAEALANRLDDQDALGFIERTRGTGELFSGKLEEAAASLESAHTRLVATNNEPELLFTDLARGQTLGFLGLAAGREVLAESIARSIRHGDFYYRGWTLFGLAQVEFASGDLERAEAASKESIRYHRILNNRLGLAYSLSLVASVAAHLGDYERAAVLFGVDFGFGVSPNDRGPMTEIHNTHVSAARVALGDAGFEAAYARGLAMGSDEGILLALG